MSDWTYKHTWGLVLGLLAGAILVHWCYVRDMASLAGVR